MLGLSCLYDPAQHELIDPPMLDWCRRQVDRCERDSLFMYRHRIHNTLVVAQWVKPRRFIDLINLGFSLSNFTQHQAQSFVKNFNRPMTARDTSGQIGSGHNDYLRGLQDQQSQYKQKMRRVASCTGNPIHRALAS